MGASFPSNILAACQTGSVVLRALRTLLSSRPKSAEGGWRIIFPRGRAMQRAASCLQRQRWTGRHFPGTSARQDAVWVRSLSYTLRPFQHMSPCLVMSPSVWDDDSKGFYFRYSHLHSFTLTVLGKVLWDCFAFWKEPWWLGLLTQLDVNVVACSLCSKAVQKHVEMFCSQIKNHVRHIFPYLILM